MKALRRISIEKKKPDEVVEANRLIKHLDSFKFLMLTVVLSKIFVQLNISSKVLQQEGGDLEKAATTLKRSKDELTHIRNDNDGIKKEAVALAKKWKVEPAFPKVQQAKVKRHFDELAEDRRFCDGETKFKVKVFYPMLDVVNFQIQERFTALKNVVEMFSVLFPKTLLKLTEDEIEKKGHNTPTNIPK